MESKIIAILGVFSHDTWYSSVNGLKKMNCSQRGRFQARESAVLSRGLSRGRVVLMLSSWQALGLGRFLGRAERSPQHYTTLHGPLDSIAERPSIHSFSLPTNYHLYIPSRPPSPDLPLTPQPCPTPWRVRRVSNSGRCSWRRSSSII